MAPFKIIGEDFPGSLVVKMACFQCREFGFSPDQGN